MNEKEQRRLMVVGQVDRGMVHVAEAARLLAVSERHMQRSLAAYRKEGVAALAHGNRGRQPAHTVGREVREQVIALARGEYAGVNQVHLTELLRYLGEAAWFPTALLSDYIEWETIDTQRAKATISLPGLTASGILHVDQQGRCTHFTAQRNREMNGFRIPMTAAPGGDPRA